MNGSTERTAKQCIASKARRFANYVLDMILFRLLLFPTWYFIGFLAANLGILDADTVLWLTDPIVDLSLTISSLFFYYFAFEAMWQRTPAKFITGTKVVNCDGAKPTVGTIALRTFIRLVPFEPFSFLSKEVYGWHDKWSYTLVVKAKVIKQKSNELSLQTARSEELAGATALLEKEFSKEQTEEETVTRTQAEPQYSDDQKQDVSTEQIGAVKIAYEKETKNVAVTHSQTTADAKEQVILFPIEFSCFQVA